MTSEPKKGRVYFGFALADSMFAGDCTITRKSIDALAVKQMIREDGVVPCVNPSHQATISAMRSRFDIEVPIPETPPKVSLEIGDSVIVMGNHGLPRLTDRHEYTDAEIANATFTFTLYTVWRPGTMVWRPDGKFAADDCMM